MPWMAAVAAGVGLLSGAAGAQGRSQASMSELGTAAERTTGGALHELRRFTGAGPGQQDVEAGVSQQRSFADLLKSYQEGGYLPTESDMTTAGQYAQDVFAPERQNVISGFEEQGQRVSQMAARLGRPVNDPILQAKLAQEQTRQLGEVGARQTSFRAQQAFQMPMQRLGFAQALTGVRQDLASQAFSNRQMLAQLGNSILTGQQADRETRSAYQAPGFAGFMPGFMAGFGSTMGGLGGMGGGGGPQGGVSGGGGGPSAYR